MSTATQEAYDYLRIGYEAELAKPEYAAALAACIKAQGAAWEGCDLAIKHRLLLIEYQKLIGNGPHAPTDQLPPDMDSPVTAQQKKAIEDREKAENVVAELNREYAFVLVGGKHAIMKESADDFELLTPEAFAGWLEDQEPVKTVSDDKIKYIPRSVYWRKSKDRRKYEKIVFDPSGKDVPPTHYNIWKGFAVQPSAEGSCDLFLAHLRDNVAQGKEDHYRWILGQFAQWVQQPAVKLGISIAFRGPQGVGKSIVGKALKMLFGKHHIEVSSPQDILGNFNAHLKHALVIQAEEAFWAGSKQAEGVLKDLITNDVRLLEYKGKDKMVVANHSRLLTTSNEDWVVPTGWGDRRFAIFDVGTAREKNHTYFGALEEQLKNGGAAKLLRTLFDFDLKSVDLWTIPETAARQEQKMHGLDALEEWWYEVLDNGILPSDWSGVGVVDREKAYTDYVGGAKDTGHNHRGSRTEFGMFLHKWAPGLKTHRPGGQRQYAFPKLVECRAEFAKRLGSDPWPEGVTWQPDPVPLTPEELLKDPHV